ncbi:hypothetical protein ACVWYF_002981 [Hymenobacter sp. UYAg731]
MGGSPALRFAAGRGQAVQGSADAPVLRTAPFGRALPILAASARFSCCCCDNTLRSGPLHCASFATRRFGRCSWRRASLRLLWLRSLRSAGLRYRKTTAPARLPLVARLFLRSRAAQARKKALRRPLAPLQQGAGHGLKRARRPRRTICVQATQANKQGPLHGVFYWGVPQAPAIMPRLAARSSSSGSTASRWSAATPSQGPLRGGSTGSLEAGPQTPWPRVFKACSGASARCCPAAGAGLVQGQQLAAAAQAAGGFQGA